MVEIYTFQPPKNQIKTIFPIQEKKKVKREIKQGENTSHLPETMNIILISMKI